VTAPASSTVAALEHPGAAPAAAHDRHSPSATVFAIAVAAGALVLQQQASLPPFWLLLALACAIALVFAGARRFPRVVVPGALALGFAWAALMAQGRLADRLDPALEGRDIELVGVVSGLPAALERSVAFDFEPEQATNGHRLPARIRLAWYRSARETAEDAPGFIAEGTTLAPGERWRFTVRLRRPHGNVNPGGFDYEAYLLERGIGATGYVRARGGFERVGSRDSLADRIEQARDAVRSRFLRVLGPTPAAGVLAALAVGDQRAIAAEEWRLFRTTGVTHLMSISGLHVTLISGLAAWLAGWLWRRSARLALALPARKAAALAAIAAAFGYTLLAGFAVPAQRTLYMVTVVALALWSGRIASPARTLALALAAVVLLDPWALLAPGFWLSFGAVALIFYVAAGRVLREALLAQWLRMQWAITLGLAPATLLFFGQVSLVGPLANAVAIPLVSGIITPLALAAALLPMDALLAAGAWLVDALLAFLEACASLPGALWGAATPSLPLVLLALAGIAWLLAPRGVPWRALGFALVAPAFVLPAPAPAQGDAWVTALDVGQGLAVLVRTASRTLLYDAGPSLGRENDAGERIILPLLASQGIARLDALVVSHQDNDHLGGAASVLGTLETDRIVSSLPQAHPLLALAPERRRCAAGDAWEWDGVRFAVLHPGSADYGTTKLNELSCVLRVATAGSSVLLAGDIERRSEAALAANAAAIHSDALLVPHHGSRTSSSVAFIAAVAPRVAVVSAGYRNRFGHPAADVVARYAQAGATLLRTDRDGAIVLRLAGDGLTSATQRRAEPRYWR
jgi:competence protein ComEC